MMKRLKKLIAVALVMALVIICLVAYQKLTTADKKITEHFTITGGDAWTNTDNTITITGDGSYTITKICECTGASEHDYQIIIGAYDVESTLVDVRIYNTTGAAMDIDGSATVTLILEGENSLISASNHAGIEFNDATGSLTITTDADPEGSLTVEGGTYGAGIGSSFEASAANITIAGGTITATGGDGAAGIGGGWGGSASNITITGGIVTATGGYYAAGIGGGQEADGTYITITGGTITAIGSYAADIGSGWDGSESDIIISGGSVKTSSLSDTLQNEDGEYVYLVEISVPEDVKSVTIDGIDQNIIGEHADDDTLYLYLTAGEHKIEVIAGEVIYEAVYDESTSSYGLRYAGRVETLTEDTDTGSTSTGIDMEE